MLHAFDLKDAMEITDTRIDTMDCLENLFCYADAKGIAYVTQIEVSDSKFAMQLDQSLKVHHFSTHPRID